MEFLIFLLAIAFTIAATIVCRYWFVKKSLSGLALILSLIALCLVGKTIYLVATDSYPRTVVVSKIADCNEADSVAVSVVEEITLNKSIQTYALEPGDKLVMVQKGITTETYFPIPTIIALLIGLIVAIVAAFYISSIFLFSCEIYRSYCLKNGSYAVILSFLMLAIAGILIHDIEHPKQELIIVEVLSPQESLFKVEEKITLEKSVVTKSLQIGDELVLKGKEIKENKSLEKRFYKQN